MQFFLHNGQWLNTEQIKKVREKERKEKEAFCMWCISKSMRHMKNCPTRLPDFDPNTYPKLTVEERDELIRLREEEENKSNIVKIQTEEVKEEIINN
jgi:hypothetical protein